MPLSSLCWFSGLALQVALAFGAGLSFAADSSWEAFQGGQWKISSPIPLKVTADGLFGTGDALSIKCISSSEDGPTLQALEELNPYLLKGYAQSMNLALRVTRNVPLEISGWSAQDTTGQIGSTGRTFVRGVMARDSASSHIIRLTYDADRVDPATIDRIVAGAQLLAPPKDDGKVRLTADWMVSDNNGFQVASPFPWRKESQQAFLSTVSDGSISIRTDVVDDPLDSMEISALMDGLIKNAAKNYGLKLQGLQVSEIVDSTRFPVPARVTVAKFRAGDRDVVLQQLALHYHKTVYHLTFLHVPTEIFDKSMADKVMKSVRLKPLTL